MKVVLILMVLVAAALGLSTLYFYERGETVRVRADSLAGVADSATFQAGALRARNTALAAALDTQMTAASRQKEAEIGQLRNTYVVRFLQDTVGIDPARLQAVKLSEYHPIASNATVRGRSQNRRIEIALLPLAEGREP